MSKKSKEPELKFQTPFTSQFSSVIKLLGNLGDEGTLDISEDGIKARGMDSSHVALIDLELHKNFFTSLVGNGKITFPTNDLVKALSVFGSSEIDVEILDGKLSIDQKDTSVNMKLLSPSSMDTPLPKIDHDILVELEPKGLQTNDFLKAGEYLELIVREGENKILGKVVGDSITLVKPLVIKSVKGEGTATYSMEYLKIFLNVFEPTTLEFSARKPCKVTTVLYDDKNVIGSVSMWLAPRVES